MKKILAGLALTAGMGLASVPASANVVSNIDFGTGFGTQHLELMSLAQQFINPTGQPNGTGSGMGYGVVSNINGASNYCGVGPCTLYYTVQFTGATFTSATDVYFTGTNVTLYYQAAAARNLQQFTSPQNLTFIQGLTTYANLVGHQVAGLPLGAVGQATGSLSGISLNLTGTGLLDVAAGGNAAFASYLNGDGVTDLLGGFADIAYTESSNNFVLNPKDVAAGLTAGCTTGRAATGAWCWQGTLNTRGVALPEPGTLALLSLSLMIGGGVTLRRRKDA